MTEIPPADHAPIHQSAPQEPRKKNIFAEVWEEDRPLNKVILSDVIRCIVICFGTTLSSMALHLAPGLQEETKHIIELVHNTILASSLIVFAILLFTEMMIIRVRRLKGLIAEKP